MENEKLLQILKDRLEKVDCLITDVSDLSSSEMARFIERRQEAQEAANHLNASICSLSRWTSRLEALQCERETLKELMKAYEQE